MAAVNTPMNMHGTGLVLNGTGILLRGSSGAGKSLLALELLDDAGVRGDVAMLVADDRVEISFDDGALSMAVPTAIAGLIELRGRGIIRRPYVKNAPLHLIVDLVDELERLVEPEKFITELSGISIARCPIPSRKIIDSNHQKLLLRQAISELEAITGLQE